MPIRDFECQDCGHRFEEIVNAGHEQDARDCPKCKSSNVGIVPSMLGSYSISGNNSASTRPRGGAFKRGGKNG